MSQRGNTSMSQSSQTHGLSLATEMKAKCDTQIQQVAHNIIQSMLLEMFNAGYAAALRDTNHHHDDKDKV